MKKRLLAFLLCVISVFCLTACGGSGKDKPKNGPSNNIAVEEDKVAIIDLAIGSDFTRATEEIDGKHVTLARMEYSVIFLDERSKADYPKLAESIEKFNEEEKNAMHTAHTDNIEMAREHYANSSGYFVEYSAEDDVYVRRADSVVTSLLHNTYTYTGGAHGYGGHVGVNYETKTGKRLALGDVVSDVSALPELIKEKLQLYWSDVEFFNLDDVDEMIKAEDESMWTLDYNGITFYFDPYSLAPYAAGTLVVTLSNEEYPELVKAEYKDIPEAYGVQLKGYMPFFEDVDGDGALDMIRYNGIPNEYNYIDRLTIEVNEELYEDSSIYAYEESATFVHTKDGRNLLYVELEGDSGYRPTQCYELGAEIKKIGEIGNGMGSYADGQFWATYVLTNPEGFVMNKRTDILGTVSGNAVYYVDDAGLPRTDAVKYVFAGETVRELTLLQDVTAWKYDEENDKVGDEIVLKKGEKVDYFAADTENAGYVRLKDGTAVKVVLDKKDGWPRTIKGVNIEEIFENMMFAG